MLLLWVLRFPRLYVAASLKPHTTHPSSSSPLMFSAALCRGLIEAGTSRATSRRIRWRFPRLYVAASLKRLTPRELRQICEGFSAALCRGLIEA